MGRTLDGLIDHLIDQIALCGEYGALPSDFVQHVKSYYLDPAQVAPTDIDDSSADEATPVPTIDRPFLERVWKWVTRNPEIRVGVRNQYKHLTLAEAESSNNQPQSSRQPQSTAHSAQRSDNVAAFTANEPTPTIMDADMLGDQKAKSPSSTPTKPFTIIEELDANANATVRIYASEDRMWYALTGHGPDLGRVKSMDFVCLSIIAACGRKGILQHDLVKVSGQDKRSLPGRTDRLRDNGYIAKKDVSVKVHSPSPRALHTSFCMLTRFSKDLGNDSEFKPGGYELALTNAKGKKLRRNIDKLAAKQEDDDEDARTTVESLEDGISLSKGPIIPQWTLERPVTNQIFDLVAQSGTKGNTLLEIRYSLFGSQSKKTVENLIAKMVDSWQVSQPLHLRHLAIVRDIVQIRKAPVHIYYTYNNFQKLVDSGKSSWEAVTIKSNQNREGSSMSPGTSLDLDEYGFPRLDPSIFKGQNNDATLAECASAGNFSSEPISRRKPKSTPRKPRKSSTPDPQVATSMDIKPIEEVVTASGSVKSPEEPLDAPVIIQPRKKQPTVVGIRQGRPRRFPDRGIPHNFNSMSFEDVKLLRKSREMADKYRKQKLATEIERRVDEGEDSVMVTHEVLQETDNSLGKKGLLPLEDHLRAQILHEYAFGPIPPPSELDRALTEREIRKWGRPRKDFHEQPYLPSIAAHTFPILDESAAAPVETQAPDSQAAHSMQKNKLGRGRKHVRDRRLVMLYLPSVASHSRPLLQNKTAKGFPPPMETRGKKQRFQPSPKQTLSEPLHYQNIPSIAAQSGSLLPLTVREPEPPEHQENTPSEYLQNQDPPSLAAQSGSFTPINLLPGTTPRYKKRKASEPLQLLSRYQYLPSIYAHSGSFLPLSTPLLETPVPKKRKYTKRTLPQIEGSRKSKGATQRATVDSMDKEAPNTSTLETLPLVNPVVLEALLTKRYKEQLTTLSRSKNGIFIAGDAVLRRRRGEPPNLPIVYYRMAVIKLDRLKTLPWFTQPVPQLLEEDRADVTVSDPRPTDDEPLTVALSHDPDSIAAADSLPPSLLISTDIISSTEPRRMLPYADVGSNPRKRKRGKALRLSEDDQASERVAQRQKVKHVDADQAFSTKADQSHRRQAHLTDCNENISALSATDTGKEEDVDRNGDKNRPPDVGINIVLGQREEEITIAHLVDSAKEINVTNGISHDEFNEWTEHSPIVENGVYGDVGDNMSQDEAVSRLLTAAGVSSAAVDAMIEPESSPIIEGLETAAQRAATTVEEAENDEESATTRSKKFTNSHPTMPKQRNRAKQGIARVTGSTAILRRDILMELIQRCGGVAPSFRELHPPFVGEWRRRGQEGVPETKTVRTVANSLCDAGKLRQITYSFQNKQGITVTKSILTFPEIAPNDPRVKEIQNKTIELHPRSFYPEALLPAQSYVQDFNSSNTQSDLNPTNKRVFETQRRLISHKEYLRKTEGKKNLKESLKKPLRRKIQREFGDEEDEEDVDDDDDMIEVGADLSHSIRKPFGNAGINGRRAPRSAIKPRKNPKVQRLASVWRYGASKQYQPQIVASNYPRPLSWVMEGPYSSSKLQPERSPLRIDFAEGQADQQGDLQIRQDEDVPADSPSLICSDINANKSNLAHAVNHPLQFEDLSPQPSTIHTSHRARNSEDLNRIQEPTSSSFASHQNELLAGSEMNKYRKSVPDDDVDLNIGLLAPNQSSQKGVSGNRLRRKRVRKWYKWNLRGTFANAAQPFHSPTGTFGTTFSGLLPPRPITRRLSDSDNSFQPRKLTEFLNASFYDEIDDTKVERKWVGKWKKCNVGGIFADSVQLFHSSTGTFGTIFSGFLPLSGSATSFHQRKSTKSLKASFVENVNDSLDWELNKKGLENIRFSDWPFIYYFPPRAAVYARPRVRFSVTDEKEDIPAPTTMSQTEKNHVSILKTRRLTALAENRTQKREIECTQPDVPRVPRKRRRLREMTLSSHEEMMLLNAVITVRSLVGGVDKRIDWGLVAKSFEPVRDQVFLQQRWGHVLQKYKAGFDKRETDFQEMFLQAYEAGTIPHLNYNKLEEYDWNWLVNWTMNNIDGPIHSVPDLPAKRFEFSDRYVMRAGREQQSINPYFEMDLRTTVRVREDVINHHAFIHPLDQTPSKPNIDQNTQLTVAKTFVRANVVALDETYNPRLAREALLKFPEPLIEEALKSLLDDRVICLENKGRLIPGRNYDISDYLLSRLRKNISNTQLHDAAAYKTRLDRAIADRGYAEYSEMATDAEAMVIMNLSAHGRIRLVPVDPPLNKWGHTGDGYETRQMDKRRLNFAVRIHPLPSYLPGNPLSPLPPPPSHHLLPENPDILEKIPLWYDIHAFLVPVLWKMVVAAVLSVLVVRPGVGKEEVEQTLRPSLDAWECERVLEWMVGAGVAKRVEGGRYMSGEWWWLVLGNEEGAVDEEAAVDGEGGAEQMAVVAKSGSRAGGERDVMERAVMETDLMETDTMETDAIEMDAMESNAMETDAMDTDIMNAGDAMVIDRDTP